ncbi:MAG TPA: phosphoribosylanthranilate isomerase [Syntrophobacteraceae bacterium]|mgnify:CR=1 FL=1|nr:phosphoribosylanthranilate isomerase [Syntrophobacteraceae bacterium]
MNSQQMSGTVRKRGAPPFPQVKVCGLKSPGEAAECARLGADAVGLVFYPPSPRFVTDEQAREICGDLPGSVTRVGVFVQEGYDSILRRIESCGINAVQLHGGEDPELVRHLTREGILVIKTLFANGTPGIEDSASYAASAFLIECRGGPLPGGNARTWDWSRAAPLAGRYPLVLAGGLAPENVSDAMSRALPDALDVSSGVEISPGRKDLQKVREFLEAVRSTPSSRTLRRIFS